MTEHILLIGMMGAGKSTIGAVLAEHLGRPYVDNDTQVERVTGRTVREIWRNEGEQAFRRHEAAALRAATEAGKPSVIAVAGGAVLSPENRERIEAAGTVVWLRAEVDTLVERVDDGNDHRPLLSGPEAPESVLAKLQAERWPLYEGLADVIVDVDGLTVEEVRERILTGLDAG